MLENLKINLAVDANKQSGNLAYEYHPFKNYLTESNILIIDNFYVPEGKAVNRLTGQILEKKTVDNKIVWVTKDNVIVDDVIVYDNSKEADIPKDSLVDLDTELFNFDLNHPVEMEILPSYDGSVNIILNDDKNITRLINSRFSAREKNTYEIVDRVGENDTNIYGQNSFEKDTSLYYLCSVNPIIKYNGLIQGDLKVGLYCFYITYCDADENESDFVAESMLIPVFIGKDGEETSMDGGIKNQSSHKGISLTINNIDSSYNYIKVYLYRLFADYQLNRIGELKRLLKKYSLQDKTSIDLLITGYEEYEDLDPNYLNIQKFNAKSVLTQALCKSMLFFGNIEKTSDDYRELLDCAVRIVPKLITKNNMILENASTLESTKDKTLNLYETKTLYNSVGYLDEEFYRFGVVFIYNNGTLSSVYNTLGGVISEYDDIELPSTITSEGLSSWLYINEENSYKRTYIKSDLDGFISNEEIKKFFKLNSSIEGDSFYNSKGVCRISLSENGKKHSNPNNPIGILFKIHKDIINLLKNIGIRGMFFVRQKRIPEVLTQCLILPMDTGLEAPVLYVSEDNGNTKDYWVESFVGQIDEREYIRIFGNPNEGLTNVSSKDLFYNGGSPGEDPYELFKYWGKLLLDNYKERLIKYNKYYHPGFARNYDGHISEVDGIRAFVNRYDLDSINANFLTNRGLQIDTNSFEDVLLNKATEMNTSLKEYVERKFQLIKETTGIDNTESPELYEKLYQVALSDLSDSEKRKLVYHMKDFISKKAFAGICPDFLLNLPYYNQIFNNSTFKLKRQSSGFLVPDKERFYKYSGSNIFNEKSHRAKICTVTEDVNTISIGNQVFKLNIGEAESVETFGVCGDLKDFMNHWDTNIVRGIYSPYLAIYLLDDEPLECGIYNIYLDEDESDRVKFTKRINSYEAYYNISNRYSFDNIQNNTITRDLVLNLIDNSKSNISSIICYTGDSYYNSFTHRLNRNFNDPSLPNNDVVLESNKGNWIYHFFKPNIDLYNRRDIEGGPIYDEIELISRGDTNAVRLGSWITFNVRSSYNYSLRADDHSYVSEEALMGSPRTFYPKTSKPWLGAFKMPDSYLYNDAFRAVLGPKCYFTLDNINYLKNTFSNRILYSDIAIKDSYKNNYRSSLSTYFRDYSLEYGSIQKLVGFEGYLLVIFEHAIGIAVINERVIAGQGDGEPVFININNVLPEELTIISDTYGTQWPESVVKSEAGFVYGVDTVAKKIWKIKGKEIELISDFKVNEFLQNNITLSERELTPTIGLKNVKTHYNNNKKDIMFTFYDDVYRNEERVWNLCYNELLEQFVTFYSWVPSYSENINTLYFSFDRNTSKNLALLHKSNFWIHNNYGVLLSNPFIENDNPIDIYYREKELDKYTIVTSDGTIDKTIKSNNSIYYKKGVSFKLEHDCWGNWKLFENDNNGIKLLKFKDSSTINKLENKIIYLLLTPFHTENITGDIVYYKTEMVALTLKSNLNYNSNNKYFKNDFYLHGNSGIIDILNPLLPCWWYDSLHPFEFEFIVNDKVNYLKIFSDLVIISNKAEPESFHFEIEGDNYEFSSDKRNMYFRQESTKNLYLNMGSDMLFDRDYTECAWNTFSPELYYKSDNLNYKKLYAKLDKVYPVEEEGGLTKQVKSTIFPLYYERIDTYDDIYDKYEYIDGINKYDFKNLSGSEIKWNKRANQFNIVTHIKNTPIDKYGRVRGNSRYKEGKWHILIPSITFMLKNESVWPTITNEYYLKHKRFNSSNLNVPPIVISRVPNDLDTYDIDKDKLPNIYYGNNISQYIEMEKNGWTLRKETKIRDKWIKIRVRYSGKNLAIIHSVVTLYNVSYS